MLPISFPQQNFVYTKPEGWTDEQCGDLPVWKGVVRIGADGNLDSQTIISCWQPSKEDIDAILSGNPIYLWITGQQQPPVYLSTDNPFIEQNTKQSC